MGNFQPTSFSSVFWDYYIAIITAVSIAACVVLLWTQSKGKVKVKIGPDGDPETTGHVWDGDLREFHNPMPRWWILLFYVTIFFSVIYLVLYPGMGTSWRGLLDWTQSGQYEREVKLANERFGPVFAKFGKENFQTLAADPAAHVIGERIFLNNCAQCHGSSARGSKGFPNLADADWLYGGAQDAILATLENGRNGIMPPMGAAVGGAQGVEQVANYVLSLSGSTHDSVKAIEGKAKFETVCAACHGTDGKGNQALGAPNLTDKIWLYGGTLATITETINNGRNNVMPSFKNILTEPERQLVGAYVWSLSHPEAARAPAAGK